MVDVHHLFLLTPPDICGLQVTRPRVCHINSNRHICTARHQQKIKGEPCIKKVNFEKKTGWVSFVYTTLKTYI